jgi:hypothetical protein
VLEEIGIDEKALDYHEDGDKLLLSDDAAAIKDFYARAFQEWSLGNVEERPGNFRRRFLFYRRRLTVELPTQT